MKNYPLVAGLLACGYLFSVACGSSNDNDGGSGAAATGSGAGGTGATGSGATSTGAGGVDTGSSSSSMASSGGSPSTSAMGAGGMMPSAGGAESDGGSAGEPEGGEAGTGVGGANMAGAGGADGCPPAPAPGDGQACTMPGLGCGYPVNTCSCNASSSEWTCFPTADDCPAERPTQGADCDQNNTACAYGADGTCACLQPQFGNGPIWQCDDGLVACPNDEPSDGSDCAFPAGFECTYGDTVCTCGGNESWNCEVDDGCPATAPDNQDPCDIPLGNVCNYPGGGGTTCACTVDGWLCN